MANPRVQFGVLSPWSIDPVDQVLVDYIVSIHKFSLIKIEKLCVLFCFVFFFVQMKLDLDLFLCRWPDEGSGCTRFSWDTWQGMFQRQVDSSRLKKRREIFVNFTKMRTWFCGTRITRILFAGRAGWFIQRIWNNKRDTRQTNCTRRQFYIRVGFRVAEKW